MGYIGAGVTRFNTADELTVTGDAQIDGTTLVVDSTNNNVGVGTSAPTTAVGFTLGTVLEVESSSNNSDQTDNASIQINSENRNALLSLKSNAGWSSYIYFGDGADADVGKIQYNHASNFMSFDTNGTEAARIDASGNLLVSTTDTNPTNDSETTFAFVVNKANHQVRVRSHNLSSLRMNRTGTDGEITQFYKDGSQVGSISTTSGDIEINSASGSSKNVDIIGRDSGGNARGIAVGSGSVRPNADNAIDLGTSSNRFKDLYLSGGAYIGGTAAANKLDDYEEGTFTPSFISGASGITYTEQSGRYTKIGNMVHFQIFLDVNTVSSTTSSGVNIGGLPFTSFNGQPLPSYAIGYNNNFHAGGNTLTALGNSNTTTINLYQDDGTSLIGTESNFTHDLYISGSYITT